MIEPFVHWVKSNSNRAALATGVAIWIAGFGILASMWYVSKDWGSVPGFWSLRSATIGDGLLLPIAGGILAGAGSRLAPAPHERVIVLGGTVYGIVAGIFVQGGWLLDPKPLINWFMPAPHMFSASGIYHAVFLCLATGLFGALAIRLFWRARSLRATHPERLKQMLRTSATAVLTTCLVSFAGFIVLDGYHLTAILTVGSVMFDGMLLVWSFGSQTLTAWRTFGVGVLVAVLICLLTWRSSMMQPVFIVLAVGIASWVFIWWMKQLRLQLGMAHH